jgi:hypothetical protein
MPLEKSASKPAFVRNLKAEIAAGKPQDQALAIAYSVKRKARKDGGKVHVGPIIGDTGGRADKRPMHVPDGAYVLTSDLCSALGEGNTLAGFKHLAKMFPKSAKAHEEGSKADPVKRASGGKVPIYAADGEWVVDPSDIKDRWGDLDTGHKILDAWQTSERQKHIHTLKHLDPPAQD